MEKKKLDEILKFRITKQEKAHLENSAAKHGANLSEYVRELIVRDMQEKSTV